ncbi:MAG: hypothetical protein LC799_08010, partial [Actinobacteria bacterium]|nr:hypothetical protein [Actinomycetota bacterium]
GAAPSARLAHDLTRIKERRRQRATTHIFSPERAARQGERRLIRKWPGTGERHHRLGVAW